MTANRAILREIRRTLSAKSTSPAQATRDGIPTVWAPRDSGARRAALPQARGRAALPDALRPHRHRRARPRAPRRASRRATSPSSITCSPSSATRTSASRSPSTGEQPVAAQRHRPLARAPTGTSARSGTCSASASRATRTCGGSSCRRGGRAIPLRKEHPGARDGDGAVPAARREAASRSRRRCSSGPRSGA